jgi:hypothetical protein
MRLAKKANYWCRYEIFELLVSAGFIVEPSLVIVSCATNHSKQAAAVDVELRFYRWDSVCIAKPDTRENGFAQLYDATEVLAKIQSANVGRRVAGRGGGVQLRQATDVRDIGAEWHARLAPLGFQRVLVFRGSDAMANCQVADCL